VETAVRHPRVAHLEIVRVIETLKQLQAAEFLLGEVMVERPIIVLAVLGSVAEDLNVAATPASGEGGGGDARRGRHVVASP
jgi:hypothetical protein